LSNLTIGPAATRGERVKRAGGLLLGLEQLVAILLPLLG